MSQLFGPSISVNRERWLAEGCPFFLDFRQLWWHASLLKKSTHLLLGLFGRYESWVMGLGFSVNHGVALGHWHGFIGINETLNVKDKNMTSTILVRVLEVSK